MGTAVKGVRTGFADPDAGGFGPYPRDYTEKIRSHLLRFENISADASIRFGRPEKGYITEGILRGGAVVWQGYLVDVEIEHRSRIASQSRTRGYVVRLREGEVIEVHNERQTAALRRVPPSVPAKRAPQDIEREIVIGGHQYGCLRVWRPDSIESGCDPIVHARRPQTHPDRTERVGP